METMKTSSKKKNGTECKIKKGKIGALGKGRGSKETVIINLVKFY